MEARQVKNTLAAMRNKTDRNDARGLAQILRTGWYSRVHVKSMHSHRVRALVASRKAILKKCEGLAVARTLVGNNTTSLEMAGASLTVTALDDEAKRLWDAPVHTAALRW